MRGKQEGESQGGRFRDEADVQVLQDGRFECRLQKLEKARRCLVS